jgi:hypothetical protein
LYDFFTGGGAVDENVFAYSNRNGIERAVVVYNNRYGSTQGTIDNSAAYADKGAGGLRQQRLREGLGLSGDTTAVLAFRDSLTGLEYLRRAGDLLERGLTLELHAYQCHVFVDWRELQPTERHPWDRLCDFLNGRGVANLEDALVSLELRPVHEALRQMLEPGLVRQFADLAEHPPAGAWGAGALGISARAGRESNELKGRKEFFDQAWARCEEFLKAAQSAYLARLPEESQSRAGKLPMLPTHTGLLGPAYRERLRAAMRIPATEALFPTPWTVAARKVLPSPSPRLTATAMWGPILAWCALELLAESIDLEGPERVALDLFDRLRLREPFAEAFTALGFEREEGWRVAARIKVVLLTGAGVGSKTETATLDEAAVVASSVEIEVDAEPLEEKAALASALWMDPDVRWLTGVHEAEGHFYLVRESYEELLWWLLMPSLLKLAGEAAPKRSAVEALSKTVAEALATAEAEGYRVDALLGVGADEAPVEDVVEPKGAVVETGAADAADAELLTADESEEMISASEGSDPKSEI